MSFSTIPDWCKSAIMFVHPEIYTPKFLSYITQSKNRAASHVREMMNDDDRPKFLARYFGLFHENFAYFV